MSGLRKLTREASPTLRLLVVNQFGINVGFYMLIPYLATYLSVQIGLAAWLVGLILGLRNLGQQGLFLLGGTLADRIGYRQMIIAGCLLRAAAFALLAFATSVPTLIAAALATGLAGALFNPAVRAYVAAESPQRPAEAFALFNVGYQAGILAGPLVGLALTAFDFRLTAVCAAAVFAALTVAQWRKLPARVISAVDRPQRVLADWQTRRCQDPRDRGACPFGGQRGDRRAHRARCRASPTLQAWRRRSCGRQFDADRGAIAQCGDWLW